MQEVNNMATKVCTKCGEEKNIEEFNRDSRTKDLKDRVCRKCKNEYHLAYREKNKEFLKIAQRLRRANPDFPDFIITEQTQKIIDAYMIKTTPAERSLFYYYKNKEIVNEKRKKYYELNKEKILNSQKEYRKRCDKCRHKRNKEKVAEYNRGYYARKKAEKNKQNNT